MNVSSAATGCARPARGRRRRKDTIVSRVTTLILRAARPIWRAARQSANRVRALFEAPRKFSKGTSGDCFVQALAARQIAYRYLRAAEITNSRLAKRTVVSFRANDGCYYFDSDCCLRVSDPNKVMIPGARVNGNIGEYARQKDLVKALLQHHGLSIPKGKAFSRDDLQKAEAFFADFSASVSDDVCVKPRIGRQGRHVFLGIRSLSSFRVAFTAVGKKYGSVLIEEMIPGRVYRFFCVAGRVVAIELGQPPNVEGDGIHTIAELVTAKNAERRLNLAHGRHPIRIGRRESLFLRRAGLAVTHVPKEGEIIFLSARSNLHHGGEFSDATDDVHRSYVTLVENAISHFPGLVLCGPDLAIQDARLPATNNNYHILELNVRGPGLQTNHYPWRGAPRDTAGAIIDYLVNTPTRAVVSTSMATKAFHCP